MQQLNIDLYNKIKLNQNIKLELYKYNNLILQKIHLLINNEK